MSDHIDRAAGVLHRFDSANPHLDHADCSPYNDHGAAALALADAGLLATPAHDAQVAAKAWAEGYDEGVQRGIGLERTGHLTTRRHELGPIPLNPYEREGASDA